MQLQKDKFDNCNGASTSLSLTILFKLLLYQKDKLYGVTCEHCFASSLSLVFSFFEMTN